MAVSFSNNEERYSAWIAENPNGFVFNHFGGSYRGNNVIHFASCNSLKEGFGGGRRRTSYKKHVSNGLDELIAIADRLQGKDGWKLCEMCAPMSA